MHITTLIDNSEGRSDLANKWGYSSISGERQENIVRYWKYSGFLNKCAETEHRSGMWVWCPGAWPLLSGGGLGAFFSANEDALLYLRTTPTGTTFTRCRS